MSRSERETIIEWLNIMTSYSRSYLEKASDEELDRIYAMNSRAE
ncbi:BH0509 family protein [Heyndrickxia ginsengihumi]|nr:BH0509 family protein [Heyndrickxia ginsengihumi]